MWGRRLSESAKPTNDPAWGSRGAVSIDNLAFLHCLSHYISTFIIELCRFGLLNPILHGGYIAPPYRINYIASVHVLWGSEPPSIS